VLALGRRGTCLDSPLHVSLDDTPGGRYREREERAKVMDQPAFVRIEYWDLRIADWKVGHAGTRLVNPALYVQKLSKRGVVARLVDKDTGEIVYGEGADLL
jgi:hypothetical protein